LEGVTGRRMRFSMENREINKGEFERSDEAREKWEGGLK